MIYLQGSDPHFRYGPIYNWIDVMGRQERIRIPELVMSEFSNNMRKPWFDQRPYLVLKHDDDQDECLEILVNELPDFVDATKTKEDADQSLVAAAMAINRRLTGGFASGPAIVVSHEQGRKQNNPYLKIPDACDHYGIRCVDFFEMLTIEGVLNLPPTP